MNPSDRKKLEDQKIESTVSSYLDLLVSQPSLETVRSSPEGNARIASLGAMVCAIHDLVMKQGKDFDEDYLSGLSKEELTARVDAISKVIEDGEKSLLDNTPAFQEANQHIRDASSSKHLLNYFLREYNWTVVSLLSASYISAFVLMRSAFELTIGIATRETGRMVDRIKSINGLSTDEQKAIKDLWYRLCAWAHPHGKWVKNVCPTYVRHKPVYHPDIFSMCLKEMANIADLFVTVCIDKYKLDKKTLHRDFTENNFNLSELKLIEARFKT